MQWGMDILDSFAPTSGQLKFLIVVIDYYTKLIEAEELANIIASNVIKFF